MKTIQVYSRMKDRMVTKVIVDQEEGLRRAENAAMNLGCEYYDNIMNREQSQEEEDYLISKAEEEWELYIERECDRLEELAMTRYDELKSWEVFESEL